MLIVFPGALGDFICFLPTLVALMRRDAQPLTLVARPEWQTLLNLPSATMISIDRREVADLFAGSVPLQESTVALLGGHATAYSWSGASQPEFARRFAQLASQVQVHAFRGMAPGEHARDYYARCAGVEPLPSAGLLRVDSQWFTDWQRETRLLGSRLLVIHAGSGSAVKNWTGFAELAQRWLKHDRTARVIDLRGPAEAALPELAARGVVRLHTLTLPQVAALLRGCHFYAGNDSGISHLAAAAGAACIVLFGPSDPDMWGPRGERITILRGDSACRRCVPERFCTHRLSVARVVGELLRLAEKEAGHLN